MPGIGEMKSAHQLRRTPSGHVLNRSGLSAMIHVVGHVEAQSVAHHHHQVNQYAGGSHALI